LQLVRHGMPVASLSIVADGITIEADRIFLKW